MRTFDDGGTGNGRWDSLKRDLKTLRRILMMGSVILVVIVVLAFVVP